MQIIFVEHNMKLEKRVESYKIKISAKEKLLEKLKKKIDTQAELLPTKISVTMKSITLCSNIMINQRLSHKR